MNAIQDIAKLLENSTRALFITGAGISAASGLPTYRGTGGLYNGAATTEGFSIEDALSANMLATRPDITWKYLWQIGHACVGAKPNPAHQIIAEYQRRKPGSWLLTQNIDGLHGAADTPRMIEIHGNAFEYYCVGCDNKPDLDQSLFEHPVEDLPSCRHCASMLRPNVVLFGEMLPEPAIEQLTWVLQQPPDLVLSIGTSAMFPYIVEPVYRAKAQGVPTVEINPSGSDISNLFDYQLRLGAAEAMTAISQAW